MSDSIYGFFVNDNSLPDYGKCVADEIELSGKVSGKKAARRLLFDMRTIGELSAKLTKEYRGDKRPPEAAEWLLDNWYLAQREGQGAALELRNSGSLRRAGAVSLLSELSAAFVRSGCGKVSAPRLEMFLKGFQQEIVLSRRELGLIVPAIRAAIIGELAAACARPLESSESGKLMGELFSSLRLLGTLDLSELLENIDLCEQTLRLDPSGIYPNMDERTRDSYRRQVSKLAKKHGATEHDIANSVLELSGCAEGPERHIGYYLFVLPMGEKPSASWRGGFYIGTNVLLSIFLSLLFGFLLESFFAALILLFPVSELVKNCIDFVCLRIVPPRHVPRLELSEGIPDNGRTICVISALLTSEDDGSPLAHKLEEFRLANRDAGKNLLFGILSDLPETKNKNDGAEKWVKPAAEAVEALNKKYGGGFYLFCRERIEDKSEKKYLGWERKRGAILSLAHLLAGKNDSQKGGVFVAAGNASELLEVKYILTLDSDTTLSPGSAREMTGAMLHPLNTPVIDEKKRVVKAGHAVIHPRMSIELSSAVHSDFSRVFAGQGGVDPYGGSSGELFMDMFGLGGFAGKGIIDVEALLFCMQDRIPENAVLSHDALEGAFLRGGFMGDVELTDHFPSSVFAYFRRMSRWVRGDWQNSPWLFRRGRGLSDIDRFKLFDCLRRSLVAPATFIAMPAAFLLPSLRWAAAAALICLASELLLTITGTLFSKGNERPARYHSVVIYGVGGGMLRTAIRLILLPYEAFVCAQAIILALWRMLISRKNMLSWQTAAQSEATNNKITFCFMEMWFSVVSGILIAFFTPSIIGGAVGVIWLLSPIVAMVLGKERTHKHELSDADRKYLLGCASEIWRFFEENTTAADHFLPPDNIQQQPPVGTAHRTSPTNIGLCLLSALSAIELNLTSEHNALGVLENVIAAVERLPKWKGHLYNWYDTRSMKVLRPAYVSTVDSGNLCCCLITLREGLLSMGQLDLAKRVDEILEPMDFSPLYDKSRRLFYIGIDSDSDLPSEGWYDLLASEARLSGYVAIAKGDVERRHWRRLGRALVQKDGYRGMASWTGTMFEYLMPELMLPCYKHSFLYESSKFCLYVQKRRGMEKRLPWGISESAFFSLDGSLSYRYKAHGCAALALKRGMDDEMVVSPYSSFLALSVDSKGVVKNLKKLEEYGARGRYGFWEAVDFTPERFVNGNPQVVRCVMAHHLGMSLVSIANLLSGGVMQRYFMSDPAMRAHANLLQEKVPIGGVLLRRSAAEPPEKPSRAASESWEKSGEGVNIQNPAYVMLSNGVYSVMSASSGESTAHAGKIIPYRLPDRSGGGGAQLHILKNNEMVSLLPCNGGAPETRYSWLLSSRESSVTAQSEDLRSTCAVSVSAVENGELRRVTLEALQKPINLELCFSFEPVLSSEPDYKGHPAFCMLGMHSREYRGTLVIRRLARRDKDEIFLCLACDHPMSADCSGELFSERSGERDIKLGWQRAPHVTARVALSLDVGTKTELRFALALAGTEEAAYCAAERILASSKQDISNLPASSAALLGINEIGEAMKLLAAVESPAMAVQSALSANEGKEGLWRFGVSGDLPIVCVDLRGISEHGCEFEMIARHELLSDCGYHFDLVFISDEGGDYRRPRASSVWDCLKKLGRESSHGARGGVHLADASLDVSALLACARPLLGPRDPLPDFVAGGAARQICLAPAKSFPKYEWTSDNSFLFYVNRSLPPRAWANILTNGELSYFASDCGTGHMWYKNARECRVGRWCGDVYATSGTETLAVRLGGMRFSLFAEPSDTDCKVRYEQGCAVWEKTIAGRVFRTTAFVHRSTAARVFIIESETSEVSVEWNCELVLSGDDRDAVQVTTGYENGVLSAQNPRAPFGNLRFHAFSQNDPSGFTCDKAAWAKGELNGATGVGYEPCFGAAWKLDKAMVIVCGFGEIGEMRALSDPQNAMAELEAAKRHWKRICSKLSVSTPEPSLDRYLNGWSVYQTIACRLLGRSSIYQSGGAFGFRDQLQDAVNMIAITPAIARSQILSSAEHQYEEGDVMHWWHSFEDGCKGVRTRCSDDLLWLPWALAEYVEKTGDISICKEEVPYITSPPLSETERERYETPSPSSAKSTVLEHAKRAVEMVIGRGVGRQDLMLMGTGDWNDGLDGVGEKGLGESVWLTWFFASVSGRLAKLLKTLDDPDTQHFEDAATKATTAADKAWDGAWYLRGRFDNGDLLGSDSCASCKIDSISQSFSVFCPGSDPQKRASALDAALHHLFDRERSIVSLFTPAFEDSGLNPGYIESYGPGFRENGGQYTHGAIWLAMALLREGRARDGMDILIATLPSGRDNERYCAEPFVLAADVYSCSGHEGVAGWSWYTGSSGWYYRVATEELLGLVPRAGKLHIEPRLPENWPGYQAVWRDASGGEHKIEVRGDEIFVNGLPYDGCGLPL